jgi:hypothetical protein
MRLSTRIDRVARSVSPSERFAACAMCGGMGRVTVSVVNEAEPLPGAPGCPRCGEVYQVLIVRKDADAA